MGINSSEQLLWTAKNLNLAQLREAVRCLKGGEDIVHIDVDCSWVVCSMARGKGPNEMVDYLANLLLTMTRRVPAIVTPILDGATRHHSKRDSTRRVADREKNRIEAIVARCSALAISSKINRGERTEDDRI
eukprot:4130525-Ditylum_brightwellii.AAC.1